MRVWLCSIFLCPVGKRRSWLSCNYFSALLKGPISIFLVLSEAIENIILCLGVRFWPSVNILKHPNTLERCGRGNQWRKALDLLAEMREEAVEVNSIVYCNAIAACSKVRVTVRFKTDLFRSCSMSSFFWPSCFVSQVEVVEERLRWFNG